MWPLIEIAIEPRSATYRRALEMALTAVTADDPSLASWTDSESGQLLLGGSDEMRLDGAISALRTLHDVEFEVGAPRVAYRETLARRVEIDHTYKRQYGGGGEFARVVFTFEPGGPGSGVVYDSTAKDDGLRPSFVLAAGKGVKDAAEHGLLAGFSVIDFKAVLTDGKFHDVDSTDAAFETAARGAFHELRAKGSALLIEPVMKVVVLIPREWVNGVVEDLKSRRSDDVDVRPRGGMEFVTTFTPLSNLFGYGPVLKSISQDRARLTMTYDHYAPAPHQPDFDPDLFPAAMALRA